MDDRPGIVGLVAVLLFVAGCGQQTSDTQARATDTPMQAAAQGSEQCRDLVAEVEDARAVRARTFGGGPEGREASRTIVQAVERRPDCFPDDLVEFTRVLRDLLPTSPAEEEALVAAEEACGRSLGQSSASLVGVDDPTLYDTPEAALAAEADTEPGLPAGQRQRSFEQDDRVGFDFHDQGQFTGWVLVERVDEGWFVRRTITCGGHVGVTEMTTPD